MACSRDELSFVFDACMQSKEQIRALKSAQKTTAMVQVRHKNCHECHGFNFCLVLQGFRPMPILQEASQAPVKNSTGLPQSTGGGAGKSLPGDFFQQPELKVSHWTMMLQFLQERKGRLRSTWERKLFLFLFNIESFCCGINRGNIL